MRSFGPWPQDTSLPLSRQRLVNFFWIVLFPASYLWAAIVYCRRRWYPQRLRYRSRFPTICVGNIHSGGSGKTPVVLSLCERLKEWNPVILSRGYKGELSDSGAKVDTQHADGARSFGDEPWMLAKRTGAPIYVGKRRTLSAKKAEAEYEKALLLLDDGFQHLALQRDLDLVVINAERSWREAACLPWGDLREPLSALRSASAIVLTHGHSSPAEDGAKDWKGFLEEWTPALPVFCARRVSDGLWHGEEPCSYSGSEKLVGFCGVAQPSGFQADLGRLGNTLFLKSFSDHHDYTDQDVLRLLRAKKEQAANYLVTTEKDWYKVASRFAQRGERLLSLRILYEFSEEFWYFVEKALKQDDTQPI